MGKRTITQFQRHQRHFVQLLLIYILGLLWRASNVLPVNYVSDHIGNFIFSGLFILFISGTKIFQEQKYKRTIIIASCVVLFLNIFFELFVNYGDIYIPFVGITFENFNTADPRDIPFGIVAVMFTLFDYFQYWKHDIKK